MNRVSTVLFFSFLFLFASFSAAIAADSIKIGAVFAKSGPVGSSNLHHVQAVRFAVDEINKNGGVLGKQIELVEYDNQGTPIQSKLAAIKAVKDGVVAVVGASWSDHSLAMAPVLQKAKIPMISPDSTNEKVTKKGDFIFRACFIDPFQGKVLAKFARAEFDAKTAAIIEDVSSSYSIGLSSVFSENFQAAGGRIVGVYEYTDSVTDFSTQLAQVKAVAPDILFVPGHDESGIIVKQAQQMGIKAVMLGGDGWGYRAFLSNGGGDLQKGYYSTHWAKDVDSEVSRKFVQEYQKVYELNDFAAISYDAMMILGAAIERAGSTDGTAIKNALASTKDHDGVTGLISIGPDGDPVKPAVILKIVKGKAEYYSTVSP